MNTSYEKERLQKTIILYAVVMVLIVVLIMLAVQDSQIKTVAIILVLLVGAASIIVQWLLLGKRNESERLSAENPQDPIEADSLPTQTGALCEQSGQYSCTEHPARKVSMKEGRRFPPCRGDKKGHSATWVLEN